MSLTYKPVPSVVELTDLYECQECGSLVANQDIHTQWHEELRKAVRAAAMTAAVRVRMI